MLWRVFGDGGGGIAIPLGMRARGVFIDVRLIRDGKDGEAVIETRPLIALGVEKGDPELRVGDDNVREMEGLPRPILSLLFRVGLSAPTSRSRELSCWAVIVMYLEARDPAVIFSVREVPIGFGVGVLNGLGRIVPIELELGVDRPFVIEEVARFPAEGVALPFEYEADGVRDVEEKKDGVILPELAGVVLPPLEDATEEGRGTAPGPTVGADNFVDATNTPHLSGHEKYCFLGEGDSVSCPSLDSDINFVEQRRWQTKAPDVSSQENHSPAHRAIILSLSREPAAQFNPGP